MPHLRRLVPLVLLFALSAHAASAASPPDPTVASATSIGAVGIPESVLSIMARQAAGGELEAVSRTPAPALVAPDPGGELLAPQAIGLNFTGATLAGTNPTGSFPPNAMGAVGPTQFVLFLDGRLVTFNKTTGVADGVLNVDPDVFFASVVNGSTTVYPRIRYDRLTARWFLLMSNVTTPNRILIAVSDAASKGVLSGSTVFTFFYLDTATTPPAISNFCFSDYPTLAIDNQAVYVGTNDFCGGTYATDGYVFRKSSLLGGGPLVVTVFRGLIPNLGAAGPFTPQGADNDSPTANEGYFIGVDNISLSTLMLRRVADPGGTPTISSNLPITVPTSAEPLQVNHLGNTRGIFGRLNALDSRLTSAKIRNGRLWTSHAVGINNTGGASNSTRNGCRWYELDVPPGTGTPTAIQSGTVFYGSGSNVTTEPNYWMPSLMLSGQNHMAMGFCTAGTNDRINAGAVGRLSGDALGVTQAPVLVTASSTDYNPPGDTGGNNGRKWGYYSSVSLDPLDDMTMWSTQMFCDATDSYGVRVTKLVAPPPATPSNVPAVNAGEDWVVVTVVGSSISGSGFYDPGPNLGGGVPAFKHLTATITNNANATGTPPTLRSVTYLTPTSVQLVLNTAGATPTVGGGQRYTVVITNPDGQSRSGEILRVLQPTGAVGDVDEPTRFALGAVRPNPSHGDVEVEYEMPREAEVRISVIDVQGREVAVLAGGLVPAGRHRAMWSGMTARDAAPRGVYFVRFAAGGVTETRRFVLVK